MSLAVCDVPNRMQNDWLVVVVANKLSKHGGDDVPITFKYSHAKD